MAQVRCDKGMKNGAGRGNRKKRSQWAQIKGKVFRCDFRRQEGQGKVLERKRIPEYALGYKEGAGGKKREREREIKSKHGGIREWRKKKK